MREQDRSTGRESRDPLLEKFTTERSLSFPTPEAVLDNVKSIRRNNGSYSNVRQYLAGLYKEVKDFLGPNIPQYLANEYAALFIKLGGKDRNGTPVFAAEAAKLEELGETNAQATEWKINGEVGASSEAMYNRFMDRSHAQRVPPSYPYDSDDLSRCVKLIDAVPGFRKMIPKLGSMSMRWRAIAENWDELETMYREQGKSIELTDRLNAIMNNAIHPIDTLVPGEQRYQTAITMIADPGHTEDLPMFNATELANDVVYLLREAGVEGFFVSIGNQRSFAAVNGSTNWGKEKRSVAFSHSAEDYPYESTAKVFLRVDDPSNAAYQQLIEAAA